MADKRTQLESVIQTGIDSALKEVHTALPGVVQAFYPNTQTADVQVTIKRKLAGELVNIPILSEVPVGFLKCGAFSITFPIQSGDHVLLIFSERSIDTWLTSGEISNPADVRRHDLSDAFAIPMIYPQTDVISGFDNTNLQIRTADGAGFVNITPDGTIELNGNGDFLMSFTPFDTLWQYFAALYNGHTHPVSGSTAGATPNQIVPPYTDLNTTKINTVKVP